MARRSITKIILSYQYFNLLIKQHLICNKLMQHKVYFNCHYLKWHYQKVNLYYRGVRFPLPTLIICL